MDQAGTRPKGDRAPVELVREGMRVVDAAGAEVGRVEFVRFGDPQAVTVSPATASEPGLIGQVAEAVGFGGEPQLPQPQRARLLRLGFVKIDGPGLTDADRYVAADLIAGVSGDTVRLQVRQDELAREV